MKMIIRADDIGFSEVCNIGSFVTFDRGLSTSADVMLDCPGTEDALRRLRDYPWISVGWHTHMWGSPVLGAAAVPSLAEHGGEFDGRFFIFAVAVAVAFVVAANHLGHGQFRDVRVLAHHTEEGVYIQPLFL